MLWNQGILYWEKKITKISYKFRDIVRDTLINKLFDKYNITNGAVLYSILTYNPLDIVITVLSAKFGISKIIVTIILAFLL